jgi:hypothetical protein
MKQQTLLKLLLASTLLTACGNSQTESERKANLGITSDGEAGEIPTIKGNQAGEGDAIKLNIAGSELRLPNNFIGEFLSEPEQRATLSNIFTNHKKHIEALKAFGEKHPEAQIPNTPEILQEYTAVKRILSSVELDVKKLETGMLKEATDFYRTLDVKGDLTRAADANSPWKTLIDTQANISLFRNPGEMLYTTLFSNIQEDHKFFMSVEARVSPDLQSATGTALETEYSAEARQHDEALDEARRAYRAITDPDDESSSHQTESLLLLETALNAAIETRVHNLMFEPVADVEIMRDWDYKPTLHAKGAQLINTISDAMYKKGFVRTNLLHDNASLMEITASQPEGSSTALEEDHSIRYFTQTLSSNLLSVLGAHVHTAVRYAHAPKLPESLQNIYTKGRTASLISEFFVVSNTDEKTFYAVYANYNFDTKSFQFQKRHPALHQEWNSSAYQMRYSADSETTNITEDEYNKIILDMHKAFLGALIPMPEFKGLFDFLKDVEGFKDDPAFMALFKPSALALSSGALHTLSSGLTLAARQHAQGVDATNLTLNGTSGSNLQLNLPVYLNLTGALSPAKTTENLSATASYYVTPNTSVGIQHTYANAGEGFVATSHQTESNAIISHTFNSVFVEGGFGYVAANQVHAHQVNGTQTYAKFGVDAANGLFSPFVQLTYRSLNQDAEFNLAHTGYAIGLDSTLANIITHAYTLTGGMSLKATYINHDWRNISGAAIGSTQFVETALSGNVNLNVNNGFSLNANASFTPTSTAVGFNVGLNY